VRQKLHTQQLEDNCITGGKRTEIEDIAMLYDLLKSCVSIFFNILNKLLGGKLPPFASASIIVEEQDHYLVVQLPRGRVAFPGDFSTWQEMPAETAMREGKEETGYDLRIEGFVGYYPRLTKKMTAMSTISMVYTADIVGGELRNNIEGRPCWMHESELRQCLDEHSLQILDDYLSYRAERRAKYARITTRVLSLVS
jgi:ADP-ribose pyrophosphatase YjhB (NUDIX family)